VTLVGGVLDRSESTRFNTRINEDFDDPTSPGDSIEESLIATDTRRAACERFIAPTAECDDEDDTLQYYHYTDRKGYNGIRSGGKIMIFKATEQRRSGNPTGVYFTTLPPSTPNKELVPRIQISRDKSQFYFAVRLKPGRLIPLRGGKGIFILYSPVDVVLPNGSLTGERVVGFGQRF